MSRCSIRLTGPNPFICGMPAWGTLIALAKGGSPRYSGMMHQPFIRERFFGDGASSRYREAGWRRRRLAVRPCARLEDAVLFTDQPLVNERCRPRTKFEKVERVVRLSRYGGDCYAYCMIAAGQIDLVIETEIKPYDIARADPDHHRRRRHCHNLGRLNPPAMAAASAAGDKGIHEAAMKALAE